MMLGRSIVGFAAGAGSLGSCISAIRGRMKFVVPSANCQLQQWRGTIFRGVSQSFQSTAGTSRLFWAEEFCPKSDRSIVQRPFPARVSLPTQSPLHAASPRFVILVATRPRLAPRFGLWHRASPVGIDEEGRPGSSIGLRGESAQGMTEVEIEFLDDGPMQRR
jgi:hypothetical protein